MSKWGTRSAWYGRDAGWLEPEKKIGELDVRFSHGREVFALELDSR